MALGITRALFILSCMVMGVIWTGYLIDYFTADSVEPLSASANWMWQLVGGGSGAFIGATVIFGLRYITQEVYERMFPVFIAISLSMVIGYFLARYIKNVLELAIFDSALGYIYLATSLVLIFGFVGITLGLTRASNWESLVSVVKKQKIEYGNSKLLDTSVLIDGRIGDVVAAGFLEGTIIVPQFVLGELQHIADSSDVLRRNKGRRGLDILKELQANEMGIDVEIVNDDPTEVAEVDGKLVVLALDYKAKIVTTDFNLNKVASIQGVQVLNLNELSNAVKTAALPDEQLEIKILKEGKEATQGVGYLEDGTMIVVDGGREYIGKRASVLVTSVLQTAAGRMIFTRMNNVVPDNGSDGKTATPTATESTPSARSETA